ncbi:MAG TPA: PaaI family thioesterase [Pseudomonadales bacterium]|nr:PaaI family thioesterase [Pseudomonadales bacterium]
MTDFPAGFSTDEGFDPSEDHVGPFYYRRSEDGWQYAFRADSRHCNSSGIVHGGVLMTFADFALCMEATNHYDNEDCLTVNFNCDFVAAAEVGSVVEARARVTRKTGSMTFVRGEIFTGETVVMTFSSVVKRLYEREDK